MEVVSFQCLTWFCSHFNLLFNVCEIVCSKASSDETDAMPTIQQMLAYSLVFFTYQKHIVTLMLLDS